MLRQKHVWIAAVTLFLTVSTLTVSAGSPWGENYFPNVPLITESGKSVRFFDDLIKDKIVSINFIYTSCPDTCPLETAQLVKVQNILGDRLGQDVFFYSISIDPETDTPTVLKEYKKKFGARWTFLTGKRSDIVLLRKKLGLYIAEIQDGSNNHNINMIIGNQTTGRWMKRSPFENPHVLADQIGNWLTGWKSPQQGDDYANAPQLRSISRGEQLFRTRCVTCHSLTGSEPKNALGPDLLGISQQREMDWLLNWLKAPDKMLRKKDPIALALYKQYNNLAMPNMRLNQQEAFSLLDYINSETQRILQQSTPTVSQHQPADDVVAIMNAWVREAYPDAKVNAGYMTLVNTGSEDVKLVNVESPVFKKIEMHEMLMVDGLMEMREITNVAIQAGSQFQFAPGGKHLMLKKPKKPLVEGQQVAIILTFDSGRQQKISVPVNRM